MNYKEKAKELVGKYDETLTYLESKNKAKQCALIAVEEVLRLPYLLKHETWFYKEVKKEIENYEK